jgi:predicted nucleotidyltransferase
MPHDRKDVVAAVDGRRAAAAGRAVDRLKGQALGPTMTAMQGELPLRFAEAELATVCQRYHVRRLSAFGSALRSEFSPESDIDLVVEFQRGRTPGLALFRLEAELSALFGRRVDLNTKASLSPYFRDRVLFEARDLYVAA